jgi:hypothetical protein
MTLTVPPVVIFALLVAVAAGGAALEPPELDEHAARPPTAMAAAASAATRVVLEIGMWHVPLGVQSELSSWQPAAALPHIDHCLPRDSALLAQLSIPNRALWLDCDVKRP